MSRYKSIKFDQFSDGEQCDVLEITDKSFESSENIAINNSKTKLGLKIKNDALYSSGIQNANLHLVFSFIYNTYLYFIGTDESDCLIKKCNLSTGAITTIVTLPDSSLIEYGSLIKFRGLAIAVYQNNAESAFLCKYSTNGMTMTTWADTNLIALAGASIYIKDFKIIHDRLFVLCSDGKIYYTDDGITFVLLVALDSVYDYQTLEYLNGYFLVSNVYKGSFCNLTKISLSGEIQDEILSIGSAKYFYHRVFSGRLYIIIDRKLLYRVEGSKLILIFTFNEGSALFIFSPEISDLLFIRDGNANRVITMTIDEKFSERFSEIEHTRAFHRDMLDYASIQKVSATSILGVAIYEKGKYIASGNIKSQIKKIPEGLAVPKQLILNHKSLTANAQVKVYVKKDQASAWGDAVIDSNATNAVRKVYNFPRGDKLSFIQVKIEYLTANSAETPEDATVEFVYLPVGLLTSR